MEQTVFISAKNGLEGKRKNNLFFTVFMLNFIGMLFHFTMVFFFTLELKSVALAGIFLGFGHFVALLADVPIGVLQKNIKPKIFFIIGAISQLISMGIFALFVFEFIGMSKEEIEGFGGALSWFLGSALNIVLLTIATICYGVTKEINDVTILSYILQNANPSQYKSILAKNNIYVGIGSLMGLLVSGVVLDFAPELIIFSIIFIILMILFFTTKYFDNRTKTVDIKEIKDFTVSFKKNIENLTDKESLKVYIEKTIPKADLKKVIENTKYIFMKPKIQKPDFSMEEIIKETKHDFVNTYKILASKPKNLLIYFTMTLVLTFGFWDTFATTFLIDFLNEAKPGMAYVFLGIIALPAYGLQDAFGKLSTKIGMNNVLMGGLILSAFSLIFMGLLPKNIIPVMFCAILNSIGYAACMSLAQAGFLENFNKDYARIMNLKEIDANASAAPMKILQNLANVIGLMLGGVILGILDYRGFFIVFGIFIGALFYYSMKERKILKQL